MFLRRRMRETQRSVRAYFFLAGAMSLVVAALYLRDRDHKSVFAWATLIADIPISIGYVIAGVRLPRALGTDPWWILQLLWVARVLFLLEDALDIASWWFSDTAPMVGMLIGPSFSVFITYYLQAHVRAFAAFHRRRRLAAHRGGISV